MIHQIATRALRRMDPEDAHRAAIAGLRLGFGPRDAGPETPSLAVTLAGLRLPNAVGLAAGFDKDAEAPDAMLRAGFGFVECGTVTPRPQAGNPRPRLFRLTEDGAVINRMGFNNQGLDAFAARLAARRRAGIVGANIGANKDTVDRAADYLAGYRRVRGLCDYVTVNVSSPNTPGLRALQTREALDDLLGRLAEAQSEPGPRPPVFLKVAPDLEADEPAEIVAAVRRHGVDGLIVSNTTVARPNGLRSPHATEAGGLSGRPLMGPSTAMLATFRAADPTMPLIGVGGVASGRDAYAKIRAGADAVQLYSALVYEGPALVTRIKRELAALLAADGFSTVAAARG